MHAIGRFAHEALVIDVIPVHAFTLPAKLSFLAAQVPFRNICTFRFLLNHVNAIPIEFLAIPAAMAEANASAPARASGVSTSGLSPSSPRTPPSILPPYGLRFLFIELCWSTHRALANNGNWGSPNVCF